MTPIVWIIALTGFATSALGVVAGTILSLWLLDRLSRPIARPEP